MNQEMPRPAPEQARLDAMTGTWTAEEKMYPSPWDPKGGTATGRIVARTALGGFFVISDYTQSRGEQVTYEGHGVYRWNPQERCYEMLWFDNTGACGTAVVKGQFEGNRLTFQQAGPMGHSRYIYDFDEPGRYRFRLEMSEDGKAWAAFMEGAYKRV